jgi:hypothetical protein
MKQVDDNLQVNDNTTVGVNSGGGTPILCHDCTNYIDKIDECALYGFDCDQKRVCLFYKSTRSPIRKRGIK